LAVVVAGVINIDIAGTIMNIFLNFERYLGVVIICPISAFVYTI